MPLTLEVLNDKLRLSLGAAWLDLTPAEAAKLQEQLTQQHSQAWQLNPQVWQQANTRLASLAGLVEQLLSLSKNLQIKALSQLNLDACLALARFSRLEAEPLSSKLNALIKQSLATKNLKVEFNEELNSPNKSSALEVAAAQQSLLAALKQLGIKLNLHPSAPLPAANPPSIEEVQTKAKNYLAYLAKIPAAHIKIILKNLAPAEIGWLVSACKTLGVEEFNLTLAKILPAATWQKLEANCPAEITPAKINQLLASLGLAFKELQQHIQNKA